MRRLPWLLVLPLVLCAAGLVRATTTSTTAPPATTTSTTAPQTTTTTVLGTTTSTTLIAGQATDIPIIGLKLIVVDKTVLASEAKAVFVGKDGAIAKGVGTDPADIEATLYIAYDSVSGAFLMPQGGKWLVNSGSVAKYVNKTAPTGGAVKVSVIKPASLVKVVGKSLGDTPLDISSAPTGSVYVVDTIVNGAETTRLCTQFAGCVHKVIAGGTGYKLICRGNSTADPGCAAAGCTASCDDGNDCTSDVCSGSTCFNSPLSGTGCLIGGVTPGICSQGTCLANPTTTILPATSTSTSTSSTTSSTAQPSATTSTTAPPATTTSTTAPPATTTSTTLP